MVKREDGMINIYSNLAAESKWMEQRNYRLIPVLDPDSLRKRESHEIAHSEPFLL